MLDRKIKTLLIEDSGFMCMLIGRLLQADKSIQLVATARNGLEGVNKARRLRPDVIITNMVMPHYDGLFVVKTLMKEWPVPIILLSSLDGKDPQIFDALKAGAFSFLEKPRALDISKGHPLLARLVHEASVVGREKLRRKNKKKE